MRVTATDRPSWYGMDRTCSVLVPYLACHKIIRYNRIPPHVTPFLQLAVVESGEFHLLLDEHPLWIPAGHFALLPAGAVMQSDKGVNAGLVYWIGLNPAGALAGTADADFRRELHALAALLDAHCLRALPITMGLQASVEWCLSLVRGERAGRLLLGGATLTLVGQLQAALQVQGTVPASDARIIEPAVRLIADHLHTAIGLDDLAEACGISLTTLYTAFRHHLRATPREYINRCRIEECCRLLRESELPIGRIAQEVGFSSSHYFATAFKKATGCTPQEYRRAGRAGESTDATSQAPVSLR